MTEKQKMLAGLPFDPNDAEIASERMRARDLSFDLCETRISDNDGMRSVYAELLPNCPEIFWIPAPFHCELGYNIRTGSRFVGNYDLRIIDYAPVSFGNHVYIGPRCLIDTRVQPDTLDEARRGLIRARPVSIGDSVWFGSAVTVCAGVSIGRGCVIGAGSIVKSDIPDDCFAAGNPARVIRSLDIDEKLWR